MHSHTWMMTSSLSCSTASRFSTFDFGTTWKQQWNTSRQSFLNEFLFKKNIRCWPQTLTAKTLSLQLSLTFMMGPYEPLVMKPRTWERKSEAVSATSASISLNRLLLLSFFFKFCRHYLKTVLFCSLTQWKLRHEDGVWRCLGVRGSAVISSRTTTCSQLSGSPSPRDARVRVEPMTEPTTPTCGLLRRYEQQIQIRSFF